MKDFLHTIMANINTKRNMNGKMIMMTATSMMNGNGIKQQQHGREKKKTKKYMNLLLVDGYGLQL